MNSARLNRQQRRAARATGKWVPLERAVRVPLSGAEIAERIEHARAICPDLSVAAIRAQVMAAASEDTEIWKNDQYQVHVIPWEGLKLKVKDGRFAGFALIRARTLEAAARAIIEGVR